MTVFKFSDRRGREGNSDPYRVGTTYIEDLFPQPLRTSIPWQDTLVRGLAEAFKEEGIIVKMAEASEFGYGVVWDTPLALAGDVLDFSTEARFWTSAHVRATIRVLDRQGTVLLEKTIERRARRSNYGFKSSRETHESAIQEALEGVLRDVARDVDIRTIVLTRR